MVKFPGPLCILHRCSHYSQLQLVRVAVIPTTLMS